MTTRTKHKIKFQIVNHNSQTQRDISSIAINFRTSCRRVRNTAKKANASVSINSYSQFLKTIKIKLVFNNYRKIICLGCHVGFPLCMSTWTCDSCSCLYYHAKQNRLQNFSFGHRISWYNIICTKCFWTQHKEERQLISEIHFWSVDVYSWSFFFALYLRVAMTLRAYASTYIVIRVFEKSWVLLWQIWNIVLK